MTAFDVVLRLSVEDAESAVRAVLADHGFRVLTEIDMAAAFKAKLG